jgi:thiol reductant ABC exporter CydC subunit
MSTLRRLLALSGIRPTRAALAVLLGTLTVVLGAALMATAGYLISRAAEQPPILSLTAAIVAVRFFGITRPLARYGDRLWSHDLALRALGRVRGRFYARIEPLAPGELEAFRRGDLLTRMIGDVDALQGLYLRGVGPALVAVAAAAACTGAAAAFLPTAGLVLGVGLVAGGLLVSLISGRLGRASGGRRAALRGELTAELVELLRAAPELALYGAEERTLDRVRELDRELGRLDRRDALVGGLGTALGALVAGLTLVAVLAVSVQAHHAGELNRVLVALLALLALSSFEAVNALPAAAQELSGTLAAGRRVLELVDREPTIRDPETPLPPPTTSAIALDSVTAGYGGEAPVLTNFGLRLDAGSRIAVVGPSGAGKTTVVNLLLRFLDPSRGRVLLAGCDLGEYRQDEVRATYALAGQQAHVFDSTIRANLLIGKPDATDEELATALRRARLDAWVESLPEGLDSGVGEDGSRLSGGQRQRLTIARALLSDAPVLVLDEPAAHLDPETAEAVVADALQAVEGRSVLLITHRPEGLDLVDQVIEVGSAA